MHRHRMPVMVGRQWLARAGTQTVADALVVDQVIDLRPLFARERGFTLQQDHLVHRHLHLGWIRETRRWRQDTAAPVTTCTPPGRRNVLDVAIAPASPAHGRAIGIVEAPPRPDCR